MDHTEAIERQAGERYLLGELSAEDVERFEAHYFDCAECATDLEAGTVLIENAKAVFREQARSKNAAREVRRPASESKWNLAALWPKWMLPATSFASVTLACICLFQAFVLVPQAKREGETGNVAVALPSFQLLGNARGVTADYAVPRNAPFFSVSFDLDPQVSYPSYRCDIQDPSGSVRFSVPASAPPVGQPITVLLSTRGLQSGKFHLLLSGVPAAGSKAVNISDYVFNLDFK